MSLKVKEPATGSAVGTKVADSGDHIPIQVVGAHVRTYRGCFFATVPSTPATLASLVPAGVAGLTAGQLPPGTTHADIYVRSNSALATDFIWVLHVKTGVGEDLTLANKANVGVAYSHDQQISSAAPGNLKLGSGAGTCTIRVECYSYESA
jgi:hypothetical protein